MHPQLLTGIIIAGLVGVVAGFFFGYYQGSWEAQLQAVTSFEECAQAGHPIMESYPEQCMTPDGRTFIRQLDERDEEGVACTMDAQLCPDGSYVGRMPPTCEFAPCP